MYCAAKGSHSDLSSDNNQHYASELQSPTAHRGNQYIILFLRTRLYFDADCQAPSNAYLLF